MMSKYEKIGKSYNLHRRADERIVSHLHQLIGDLQAAKIADIGAGTGNYTNALADLGNSMFAIEPSSVMRNQSKRHDSVRWFDGAAESLPLSDASVDAVICTLAIHHFINKPVAILEMLRVCSTGPIVVFTIDPRMGKLFWFQEYFPQVYERLFKAFEPVQDIAYHFEKAGKRVEIIPFPLPKDLVDINMHAGWSRPEIYLDQEIRCGMSGLALAPEFEVSEGLTKLQNDLECGVWDKLYGHYRALEQLDLGFYFLKVTT